MCRKKKNKQKKNTSKSNMALVIRHGLAQSPKIGSENQIIMSMSVKEPGRVKAHISSNLLESVIWMAKTDQLPLHRGIRSRALSFGL